MNFVHEFRSPSAPGYGGNRVLEPAAGNMKRKRATKACVGCRSRKVRCDVERHGQPCTNCNMDCVECVVKPRARKSHLVAAAAREQAKRASNISTTSSPCDLDEATSPPDQARAMKTVEQRIVTSDASTLSLLPHNDPCISISQDYTLTPEDEGFVPTTEPLTGDWLFNPSLASSDWNSPQSNDFGIYSAPSIFSESPSKDEGPFIPFSTYPAVRAHGLEQLGREELSFLEQKGCLLLPKKPVLDQFLQQYFLRVHPILPVLKESDIRSAFLGCSPSSTLQGPVALVIMQAILFLASPYASDSMLSALGLPSVHAAQGHFYAKTKALYDIDMSQDDVTKAQVALMLTYYAPTASDKINTYWMVVAVHHARSARAHQFGHLANDPRFHGDERKIRLLKRLWWCCILRDRIMSLGLRRPLCIHPAEVDPDLPHMTMADFADEISQPWFHSRTTKEMQVRLMLANCRLGMILGDILETIYPLMPSPSLCSRSKTRGRTDLVTTRLEQWHEKMRIEFKDPKYMAQAHESLYILISMSYIYYHTAKIAFYNHMMLLSFTEAEAETPRETAYSTEKMQMELDRSLRHITDDFTGLEGSGLVKYLPNTFIHFSILPFIWHIIFAKIANTACKTSGSDLKSYVAIMRTFKCLYGRTDSAIKFVEDIVAHIKANESRQIYISEQETAGAGQGFNPRDRYTPTDSKAAGRPPARTGANLFGVKPHSYLRISLTVDYSLSCGQLLSEKDFPKALHESRGLDQGEFSDGGFYQYLQRSFDISMPA